MRLTDLIKSAAGGLWQPEVRTVLTLTGVSVGTCSLAFSLSLGVGLRAMIDREFKTRPGFWEIDVTPRQSRAPAATADPGAAAGALDPDRAARLRQTLAERAA